MIVTMNWKYAFAVMLCAGVSMGQQPEQPAPARISGKVTGAGGQVVRRADVKLVPWSNRANPGVSTTADTEGNFEFKDVEPGRYRLSASKSGFLPQDYGARGPNQPGVPIAVAKGQEHKNLSISLLAAGTISGKVLDEDGEPMGKCLAMVLRQSVNAGRRQWIPRGGTLVNDKGEFSVGDLPPGKYHLLINPPADWNGTTACESHGRGTDLRSDVLSRCARLRSFDSYRDHTGSSTDGHRRANAQA